MTRRLVGRLLRGESGVGLVELLVVMVLMSVVGGVVVTGVLTGFKQQRTQIAYVESMNSVKQAFERTTRELRAADPLVAVGPESVTVRIRRDGTCKDVALEMASDGRLVSQDPVGSPERDLATGLLSGTPTFAYYDEDGTLLTPPLTDVELRSVDTVIFRARAPIEGGSPMVLQNRIHLRNEGVREC